MVGLTGGVLFHHLLCAGEHPQDASTVNKKRGELCADKADRPEIDPGQRIKGQPPARTPVKAECTGVIACQHERDHCKQQKAVVEEGRIGFPVAKITEESGNIKQNGEDIICAGGLFSFPAEHRADRQRNTGENAKQTDEGQHHGGRAEAQSAPRAQPKRTKQTESQILPGAGIDLGKDGGLFQTDRSQRENQNHQNTERDERHGTAA